MYMKRFHLVLYRIEIGPSGPDESHFNQASPKLYSFGRSQLNQTCGFLLSISFFFRECHVLKPRYLKTLGFVDKFSTLQN